MDNNNFYESYPAGGTNNPRPILPDTSGARHALSRYRLSSTQFNDNLDHAQQNEIVTQNPYGLMGTDDWVQYVDSQFLPAAYPLNSTSSQTYLGYYHYQPELRFYTGQALDMIGSHKQYIPDRQLDQAREDDTTQFSSAIGQPSAGPSYSTASYENTVTQASNDTSTYQPLTFESSTVDANIDYMDFKYDLNGPPNLSHLDPNILQEQAQQADQSQEIILYSSKSILDREKAFIDAAQQLSKKKCVRCHLMKKGCVKTGVICDRCKHASSSCCISLQTLFPLHTISHLYKYWDNTITRCLQTSNDPLLRRRAKIFLPSGNLVTNRYLKCEVDVSIQSFSDTEYSALQYFKLCEDLSSEINAKVYNRDEPLSCTLVCGSLPPFEECHEWVLESAQVRRSGAVGAIQGALFNCSRSYTEDCSQPFHELVRMAVIHTSLYHICQSRSSLILEDDPRARFRVCPALRAEVFAPLFMKSGEMLYDMLESALRRYPECPKKNAPPLLLPLYLVVMMLFLTHLHSHLLTENQRAFSTNRGSPKLSALEMEIEPLRPEFEEELQIREEKEQLQSHEQETERTVVNIRILYRMLFKERGKLIGNFLRTDGQSQLYCKKCPSEAGDDETRKCLHNEKLRRDLASVINALKTHQPHVGESDTAKPDAKFPVTKVVDVETLREDELLWQAQRNRSSYYMEDIGVSDLWENKGGSFGSYSELDIPLANPPPSQNTVCSSKRSNAEEMSIDSKSSKEGEFAEYFDGCLQEMEGEESEMICQQKLFSPILADERFRGWLFRVKVHSDLESLIL